MKRALLVGLIPITAVSASCTAEQLAHLNIQPDQPVYAPLLEKEDVPVPLGDGSVLEVDGSVTPAPPPPAGPSGSSCERMDWHRADVGLPPQMDRIGRRESGPNCDNSAISRTGCCVGCCVGWWQLHKVHFNAAMQSQCGATWRNVRGSDPDAERRQACAAKVIYDRAGGLSPWSARR